MAALAQVVGSRPHMLKASPARASGFGEPPAEHGGDLTAIRAAYPRARLPWIDLSTGINPWPYPVRGIPASAWHRLPGAAAERAVRLAAASYYGALSEDDVVLAPGSQAIIQWLPRLRPPCRVAVLEPSYGEHARSWADAGCEVLALEGRHALPDDIDVLVVTRPNNPDGRSMPLSWLADAAGRLQRRGGWLVIDEAFADTTGQPSAVTRLRSEAVIGLRSFGKFFGLAGGRLGFALATGPAAERLRAALGPWCVSGPILHFAARALPDKAWIERTRTRLARGAARLDRIVRPAGLRLVGGTGLFRLYESPEAARIFATLAAAGIYVRRFAAHPTWLRFGLPPDGRAERRLARALGLARRSY